jgi:uncharacterized lipoprotein
MMYTRFVVVSCLIVLLAGCGLFRGKDEYAYRNAKSEKPLQIPQGLHAPPETSQYEIPPGANDGPDADPEGLEQPPQIVKSVDLSEAQLAQEAAKNKAGTEQGAAGTAKTSATKAGEPIEGVTSRLTRNADGDSVLLVDADFDRVWPLLEPALKELGFTIDDSSRGAQVITVSKVLPTVRFEEQAPHPADEEPEVKEEYQIHLETADDKTRVTVHNKFGTLESSGLSEHLLLQISEIIKNPKAKKAG